jgi:hypothetical protein
VGHHLSERLTWLAERLPAETLLRLGLMFSPAMLLGLVLLAGTLLVGPSAASRPIRPDRVWTCPATEDAPEKAPADLGTAGSESRAQRLRSGLALGVLVVGLGFTALAGMATLVAIVFILTR